MTLKDGSYTFTAAEAERTLDMDWLHADGLVGEGRTFDGLTFEVDGARVSVAIYLAEEDETGLIRSVRADWHEDEMVKRAALVELLEARRVSGLMGELVKRREALGLSQARVAEMLDFTATSGVTQVSRFETGKRTPSVEILTAWGEALGLKLAWQPL